MDAPARLVAGGVSIEGRIENISAVGASFITSDTSHEFGNGTLVTLCAPDGDGTGGPKRIAGRLVRSETLCSPAGDEIAYAVEFDIPPAP